MRAKERKKRESAHSRRIVPCCFWRAKSLAVARWPQMWIKKPLTCLFFYCFCNLFMKLFTLASSSSFERSLRESLKNGSNVCAGFRVGGGDETGKFWRDDDDGNSARSVDVLAFGELFRRRGGERRRRDGGESLVESVESVASALEEGVVGLGVSFVGFDVVEA